MTAQDRLAEIQARLDAATPGPWSIDWSRMVMTDGGGQTVIDADDPASVQPWRYDSDACFIAASRTDMEALVAALRAVIEDAERWKTASLRDPVRVGFRLQAEVTLDLVEKHLGGAE